MDEEENRRGSWLGGLPVVRQVLAGKDWLAHRYYRHVDRYHQVEAGVYRVCTRLVVGTVVLAAAIGAYLIAGPSYRHYQEHRGATRAMAYLAGQDYRNAQLCAWQALHLNPSNVPACRVMAELADRLHSPSVLDWQQRIVAIEPTVTNKLMLAASGLRYQKPPFPLTTSILAELPASATNNPTYQLVAATLAMGRHHLGEAENHFASASQLDPTNQVDLLDLAILQLALTNEAVQIEARATLEKLSSDRKVGARALRALVADRLAKHDLVAADGLSTRLLADPSASFQDRLQNLGLLRRLTNAAFSNRLAGLEQQAATNATDVGQVSAWMQANGLTAENLEWLDSLPSTLRSQPPVELALADGWFDTGDWRALRDFATKGNWGNLEYLRFALVSHACAQMGMSGLADVNWNSAVNEADISTESLAKLKKLVELASQWRLQMELKDLLSKIVDKYPKERWATAALTKLYFTEGNTVAINQLSDRLAGLFPAETVFKNNLAATELLLKTNLAEACELAAEAYTNTPGDPNEATTYAFSLHVQGRDPEGLALLEKLRADQLEDPSVALYYGILLEAAGRHEAARTWLGIAQTKGHLLPEEKQLLLSALGK